MDWVAVGLSVDVPPGVVIPGRVDGTDLAIWCTTSGIYHAWTDRCPHRGMRLSHGFVRGDTLACIYHGWQYREDGTCGYIPAHPKLAPPKTICVPTYTCAEAGGVIWVSLQGTAAATPDTSGRHAVRSLPVDRPVSEVAMRFGADSREVIDAGTPNDIGLALQPVDDRRCMIHALAGKAENRKDVSRWLESLRQDLEGAAA